MEQNVVALEQKALYYLKKRFIRMKLALCDDDKTLVQKLKQILYQYANTHKFEMVIDSFYCGEDLIESKTAYDMIFLDFQMGELDGLSAAKILREKSMNCAIIFMTSYPHFVYKAFEVNTFRFFEKPVEAARVHSALDDYFSRFGNDYPILLTHNRETVQVDTKSILFLEAVSRNCLVHLQREQLYCIKPMSAVSALLPKSHFCHVHRSFIVNLNCISRYNNVELLMKNGEVVPFGRNYYSAFRVAYREHSDVRNPKRSESPDAIFS